MMERPSKHSNFYFQQLLNILGTTATAFPFAIIGLGLLVRYGLVDNRFYMGDLTFAVISVGFIVIAAINYYLVNIRSNPSNRNYLFLSIGYHILGISYLLCVTGFVSPYIIAWVLLMIAVDTYFGTISTLISIMALYGTCLIFLTMHPWLSPEERVAALVGVLLISITGVVVTQLRGVTDRERIALAQARDQSNFQRERLLALVNSMGDAVITTDESGRIKIYNAATLSLLDTNENLTGKNIDKVLHARDSHDKSVNLIKDAKKHHMVLSRTDLTHKFAEGEVVHLYLNMAPVQPGYHVEGERGFIFILRDITKEKTLEEERDEFISVVSHELRTPIAIAEGNMSNIQLLIERGAAQNMVTSAAKSSHDQIMYLAKLINDLSTLSRAERGVGADAEVIDMNELLNGMYKSYAASADAKGIHLNIDIQPQLPKLFSSRLYMEEILQNLITNAIKYTKEGNVTINAKQTDDGVYIAVKDSGIGISKSDQKHIFEKFYRSEDYRTRESSGTGLGLYVCKKLAEKLNITIKFESRLNHGSTFSFVIAPTLYASDGQKSAR